MLTWKSLRHALSVPASGEPASPSALTAQPDPKRMTLLLVGRNRSLRESLGVLGLVRGWDVRWAETADEAVEFLARRPIPLVICEEAVSEGWRGIVERIAFLPQSTCILLASRFSGDTLRREACRHYAYDVISIPFNWQEVTDRVLFAWSWYASGCKSW